MAPLNLKGLVDWHLCKQPFLGFLNQEIPSSLVRVEYTLTLYHRGPETTASGPELGWCYDPQWERNSKWLSSDCEPIFLPDTRDRENLDSILLTGTLVSEEGAVDDKASFLQSVFLGCGVRGPLFRVGLQKERRR